MHNAAVDDERKESHQSGHSSTESAMQHNSPSPPHSIGTSNGSEFKFKSSSLASLSDHTRKTVESQSRYAIGESATSATSKNHQQQQNPGRSSKDSLGGLASILESLGAGASGVGGAGEGGAGGLGGGMNQMVDFILQNLLSKEVLYGPLVEIRDKYPSWLEKQRMRRQQNQPPSISHVSSSSPSGGEGEKDASEALSEEGFIRYQKQYESIQRVCTQVSLHHRSKPFPPFNSTLSYPIAVRDWSE